ncbi:hypothetical protein D3C72_2095350 [compost metagenome]
MGKQVQVAAFGRVQFQDARQVFQEGGRHADVAALFEPRVPGQAHARQRGHFLAAQSGRSAAAAGGQAQVRRTKARAAQAQEFGQVRTCAVQTLGDRSVSHHVQETSILAGWLLQPVIA